MRKARFLTDSYSTHQPVLFEAVMRTTGPVVEFGCGYGSTPMLHELCKEGEESDGRNLLSLESDPEYYVQFLHLRSETHKLELVTDWPTVAARVAQSDWDVAFIDNAPWEMRVIAVEALKDKARYVVLHDCDYFIKNHLLDFEKLFKYHKVYLPPRPWPSSTGPPTLLASNCESCEL